MAGYQVLDNDTVFKNNPENSAGFLSRITFWYVQPLLKLGYQRPLTMDDLYPIQKRNKADYLASKFSLFWKRELNSNKPSIIKALHHTFGRRLYLAGILKVFYDILLFVGPLTVYVMVDFVQDTTASITVGLGYILLYFCSAILQSILIHSYFKIGFEVAINVRTAIAASVYDKALKLTNASRQTKTVGEIVNLMSVDARKINDIVPYLHLFWSSPLQIIIGFCLLAWQMGIGPTFAGIIVLALTIPLNALVTRYQAKWQDKVMQSKDARVKAVAEALQAIRVIKFFAWESSMLAKIAQLRKTEMSFLKKVAYMEASSDFFWTVTPSLVTVATFVPYLLMGKEPSAAKVYAVLTILNVMRFPMSALPFMISSAISAFVSKKRVEAFLLSEELDQFHGNIVPRVLKKNKGGKKKQVRFSDRINLLAEEEEEELSDLPLSPKASQELPSITLPASPPQTHADGNTGEGGEIAEHGAAESGAEPAANGSGKEGEKEGEKEEEGVAMRIKDGEFAWSGAAGEPVILSGINLEVKEKEFVVIVGPVGCGKSSLLAAMLQEMHKINGRVELNDSVAYVAQSAWIVNATLKDNILLGSPYDEAKYQAAVAACALVPDLNVLPGGDQCEIGEKGINLSGGQKQRVALARAVYKNMETYLLDDPLSAVDSGVGHHLLNECILGALANRTRILVTHQLYPLPHADRIVVMQGGKISAVGTYAELVKSGFDFATYVQTSHTSQAKAPEEEEKEKKKAQLVTVEERNTGSVSFSYFKSYFKSVGYLMIFGTVTLGVIGCSVRAVTDWWIAQTDTDKKVFFSFYLGLTFIMAVVFLFEAFMASIGGLIASTRYHDSVLLHVFRSPVSFFDSTPVGRILNRFSRDQDSLDTSLPIAMYNLLMCGLPIITTIGVILIVSPFFLVPIIPIAYLYRIIERYYIASSRELQRLDSISISPVYSHFTETINGVVTIRAYKMLDDYKKIAHEKLDRNNFTTFPALHLNRWLSVRLEFCGSCIVVSAAILIVISRNLFYVTPALAGLALSYALSTTGNLSWLVRSRTDVETRMNSVERMEEYKTLPAEGAVADKVLFHPNDNWPSQGEIVIKNLQLRYRPDLDLVLRGITCRIEPGQKIGVCGRTGSGKSSLMQALFRLVEPCGGTVEIDGVDITQVPLERLRDGMAIIPQDPVLFEGTVRYNLDPFEKYSDSELVRVLNKVRLDNLIRNDLGLSTRVAEGGENLSVGERQLLCLARALLKHARIIILDEATAAVDHQTDEFIQQTIRTECSGATIIAIAHRLNTLTDYDNILVLDNGVVVQMGPPSEVLKFANKSLQEQ
eukprot:Phypoly_transcript_00786.p1 GENE.Phypoly_transcript_00786~~Phypoly_transcript_00786.p1  ORF type:complete len:1319 (+),score=220.66 Phypoly_transcript_00786:74-4030(+)